MYLIIGLGNYPKKYEETRHNFGFLAIDFLKDRYEFSSWKYEKKFFAECAYGEIKGYKTILVKPQTYMNDSGKSVGALVRFYKISPSKIFLISDDLDQDFGNHRIREKGNSGGQKGLENIIQSIGTANVTRLKFGINNDQKSYYRPADFVLSKFTKTEQQQLPVVLETGIKKLEQCIK